MKKVQLTETQAIVCTIAASVICWAVDQFLLGGYIIPGGIAAMICGYKIGEITGG